MKIALKAANGLYVSAEEGGGIDTRDSATPVAIRANRPTIGPWETFEVVPYQDEFGHYVALKTANGFYVTAENGGGGSLSTNRQAVGAWELFTPTVGGLQALSGHFVCAEVGSPDPVVNATRTVQGSWETFAAEVVEPDVPVVDKRKWRGAFVIPNALPGIPYGDGRRIWTPAYGCYDDNWRAQIRNAYTQRGYTHFPYNCAGLPYAWDYPELADDSGRVARDLDELTAAGLVPVVCATDDRNRSLVPLTSFLVNANRIPVAFPMWEMNGVLNNDEQAMKRLIDATHQLAPATDLYLHFTPGHGSISYVSEIDGWKWCQDHGTTGLMAQGNNSFPPEDPVTGGQGLESSAIRLAGRVDLGAPPAWGGLTQLTVKFEYGVSDVYHSNVSEDAQRNYTMEFLKYAPHVVGYCDGGR